MRAPGRTHSKQHNHTSPRVPAPCQCLEQQSSALQSLAVVHIQQLSGSTPLHHIPMKLLPGPSLAQTFPSAFSLVPSMGPYTMSLTSMPGPSCSPPFSPPPRTMNFCTIHPIVCLGPDLPTIHYAPWVLPSCCPAPSTLPWLTAIHGIFGCGNSILLRIFWLTLVIVYKSRIRTVIQLTGGQPNRGGKDGMVRREHSDHGGSQGPLSEMLKLMHKSTLDLGLACLLSFISQYLLFVGIHPCPCAWALPRHTQTLPAHPCYLTPLCLCSRCSWLCPSLFSTSSISIHFSKFSK